MKRFLALFLVSVSLVFSAEPVRKPKLAVVIVIDQFRYDYLTRFRAEYHGGFDRLLTRGAVFTNANYEHFPTVTAVGHSTVLSGAIPSLSGIIENGWFDRETGKQVASIEDSGVKIIEGGGSGASPRRLLVSTVGDELKIATGGRARVIGISLKDRAAILPAGHSADAAYWFDGASGHIVTSTYYLKVLPEWVQQFNADAARPYLGASWLDHQLPRDATAYSALPGSPFGNELIEAFAERAIQAEKLGHGPVTDLLTISFSANDYVGHKYGPDSPEVHEMCIRTDKLLDKLLRYLDLQVGSENALIVLTGDHGVAPTPEANAARKMPGGRLPEGAVRSAIETALVQKYGEGKWIAAFLEEALYLNYDLIREKKLDRNQVAGTARDAVMGLPHVFRAFTHEELATGAVLPDTVGRLVMNGFNAKRSGDLYVLLDPYWMAAKTGTEHGSPFTYDTHVPVIFMGTGIRAGWFDEAIVVNDIAPTLATLLETQTPSGSVGRALSEIFSEK